MCQAAQRRREIIEQALGIFPPMGSAPPLLDLFEKESALAAAGPFGSAGGEERRALGGTVQTGAGGFFSGPSLRFFSQTGSRYGRAPADRDAGARLPTCCQDSMRYRAKGGFSDWGGHGARGTLRVLSSQRLPSKRALPDSVARFLDFGSLTKIQGVEGVGSRTAKQTEQHDTARKQQQPFRSIGVILHVGSSPY